MNLKKTLVPALLLGLALCIVTYFKESPNNLTVDPQRQTSSPSRRITRELSSLKNAKAVHKQVLSPRKIDFQEDKDSKVSGSFSYDKAKKDLHKLEAEYPASKKQLIDIITKEDIYETRLSPPQPHSAEEWTQIQRGAIKVMALRSLMSKGRSPQEIQSDLKSIIKTAKDPTIKQMAQAALESSNKGRPFFEDLLDALQEMAI